jgi:hypothetical protein
MRHPHAAAKAAQALSEKRETASADAKAAELSDKNVRQNC